MEKLLDVLSALRLMVDDRPEKGEAAIVDRFAYAAVDMMSWFEEGALALKKAKVCSDSRPADLDGVRDLLSECQDRFHRVQKTLTCELDHGEAIGELVDFGRQRRGEWLHWVSGIRDLISRGKLPLMEVSQALAQCWQELTERIASTGFRMGQAAVQVAVNEPVSS